ncbi:hypothetical protein GE21DRAFT_777 [Neurospora crassa]|uniref:Chitin synthase activator n=1 Tax=Neurospora crassa (strain ATCC 24698 / 74-OR23-1A / CBS 708.71 / DSM 1257 / FGSC 987) TaxID=367110 RepID=Q7SG28_NEUCR|nr:chitin synthase activator [Neurospora crassa OR74A]EAA35759.1 chitin synthase activator [Neurospora crassa OR74A]KHE90029.1 hypothetical protein GE21DRAFT_777 [Neurospora crassa]|eukprot:XP_964995.1 chitin synthase activator [Neurospora crassa OR74A]
MAYSGGYEGGPGGRQYGGQAPPPRGPPQRAYTAGPGMPQQQYTAPPPQQHYDRYQEDYGYGGGYNDHGGGYDQGYGGQDQGYGGQYDDRNYQRGPPAQDYPQQDYFIPGPNGRNGPPPEAAAPGPGPGRGGPPMQGGRAGPAGPMRPPADNGRGPPAPYPPRGGGYPPGPGRGYPPQGPGGRPGPPDRAVASDPSANRRPPMNGPGPGPGPGPLSPENRGFGGGNFRGPPGAQRRPDVDNVAAQMDGMNLSIQRPPTRGPPGPNGTGPQRAPMRPDTRDGYGGPMRPNTRDGYGGPGPGGPQMGPPQPYRPQQDIQDQRRGPPPGPDFGQPGVFQDGGFGPPGRSMTMPARDDMGFQPPPQNFMHQSDSVPYNGPVGRAIQRPNTAQGARAPPQRVYPSDHGVPPLPQNNYDQGYGNRQDIAYGGQQQQQQPGPVDDYYEDYYEPTGNGGYPAQSDGPNFDAISPHRHKDSFDQHMQPNQMQHQAQRGPGRLPEMSRAKSQPDLRNSQTAVFEMAGDMPPIPMMQQQQTGGPRGSLESQNSLHRPSPNGQPGPLPPGAGITAHPAPYRPGQSAPPQGPYNSDNLPLHPAPVRPGQMPGSMVNLNDRPPPVRNYQAAMNSMPAPPPLNNQPGPQPMQGGPGSPPPPTKPVEPKVTVEELEHLRAIVKNDSNDQQSALRLAKKLVEASDVLVPNLPDPKARARSRDRYLVDAHKILRKLEKASNPDAMFFLADSIGRGLFSSEPDHAHAFSLYQSAAKLGHAAAAYRTAVCCEIGNDEGGGTRKDPIKAIQWYKRAATLGDTPAMYKVGMILLKGLLGQPKNRREAISWLKRAAERADTENPHALHELALLYASAEPDDVILRDEAYAFSLFKQAAELGYKFSQFRLGAAYEYGLFGCPIDPRLSIMWYSRAATQEEHQSELALSGWYFTGSEGVLQQNDTEAYLWARKAAMAGLAKAEFAMGYFTEEGIGVPANLEDAKRWYWRAAAQDHPKARERLEELKRSGKNGPRNREKISRNRNSRQQEGECLVM